MQNTAGSRIKQVRESLRMSGSAFAEQIGLSRGALSNIERNVNGVSERTLRLICQTFNVDYFWLTEGKGEMFVQASDSLIEELAAEHNLSADTVEILKALFNLPKKKFDLVMELIRSLTGESEEKEQE